MEFKDFLRQRRLEIGLSQTELGDRLSLSGQETSHARVGHWETGRNKPPLEDKDFRIALATALEMDVNQIMEELGFIEENQGASNEARLAASIVDNLPPDARQLAIEHLRVIQRRFNPSH